MAMFLDRIDAGRQLAEALVDLRDHADPIVVLAIPRGGVSVAREVARALRAPLDICLTHKIGAPGAGLVVSAHGAVPRLHRQYVPC